MEYRKTKPDSDDLNAMLSSLFQDHSAFLVELAQGAGCSPDFAEDMVMETFQVAVKKAEVLYHSENRLGWLVLTLKHRLGDNYRAMQYAQKLQRSLETLYVGKREDQIGLEVIYSGLVDPEELKLLIRFYVEKWSNDALAASLGIKPDACKKRIQRAKARFMAAYKKYIEDLNK